MSLTILVYNERFFPIKSLTKKDSSYQIIDKEDLEEC